MTPTRKIRLLSIVLIIVFALGVLIVGLAIFVTGPSLALFLALAINCAFVVAAAGLFKVKRWGWWLTIFLCAFSILQHIWQVFTALTPETATKSAEIASYIVVGLYLGIAFFLTSDSVRRVFREGSAPAQPADG